MSEPIRLTADQQAALSKLAEQSGKPWEEVFQEALAWYEHKTQAGNGEPQETVYAAMVRVGLLGCVEGPPDLSTNPSYMEGFGSRGR